MNRRLALWTGLGALLVGRVATAQEVTIGYQGLPYKSSGESSTGLQVSDGVILHAGIGAEAGYDTNVFYSPASTANGGPPVGSTIVRVMPYLELTNATRTGPVSRDISYDVRAGLQYRYYGSDNPNVVRFRSAWMPNAGVSLSTGGGQIGFGVADVFARSEDAPYQAQLGTISNPLTHDNNQASIEGRWSPGGGRLTSMLRYTNMIDVYDAPYTYANDVVNTLTLDVAWKWLPKTAIFLDVQQGYIGYLNSSTTTNPVTGLTEPAKSSSFPLSVTAGLRGLLTAKTSAVISLGYVNGFYSNGNSTGGWLGSTTAKVEVTVQLTQLSRAVIGVQHAFANAVISSFSYDETAYLSYVQQIVGRLGLDLSGRYQYIQYEGTFVDPSQNGRVDNNFLVGASLDYFLRNWAYLGIGYSLTDNSSNFAADDYLKQQVFARLGITY